MKNTSDNPINEEKNEAQEDIKQLLVEYQSSVNKLQKENQDLIQKNEELQKNLKCTTKDLNNFKEEKKNHTESLNLKTNSKLTLLEQNLKIQRQNHKDLLNYLKEERQSRIGICHKFNQKQAFLRESMEKVLKIKEVFTVF